MNIKERGEGTIWVSYETYTRLNAMAIIPRETFNEIVIRLLDHWDKTHGPSTK